MKTLLLQAPDTQICPLTKAKIKNWSATPTSLEILETLDYMIFYATASGFAVATVEMLLNETLKTENKTLEEILPLAHWRKLD